MTELDDLRKRVSEYEKILGIGENDPVKNAFIVYVRMLNQQTDFLKEFNIKTHISKVDKDSPEYKRAMEMVDGLPKMIASVNDLKATLKLTKEDMAELKPDNPVFAKITTPETIADNVGEVAGKR